jgi:hypothetical protein
MGRAKTEASGESKMGKVRAAMDELGPKAKPQAIQEYIKTKFNADISKNIISTYKFHILKKGGSGTKRGRPAGSTKKTKTSGTVLLDDLAAVQALVKRIGSAQVKQLVDMLG